MRLFRGRFFFERFPPQKQTNPQKSSDKVCDWFTGFPKRVSPSKRKCVQAWRSRSHHQGLRKRSLTSHRPPLQKHCLYRTGILISPPTLAARVGGEGLAFQSIPPTTSQAQLVPDSNAQPFTKEMCSNNCSKSHHQPLINQTTILEPPHKSNFYGTNINLYGA